MLACLAVAVTGCANYADQLARAEQHYGNARYEAALVNLEDLEIHLGGLSKTERVRYDLVRGMTHLRLAQRQDARHWLAIAREDAREVPSALTDQQRSTIERTLVELDPLGAAANPCNPCAGTSASHSNPSSSGGESR
jgi:hypothetical protein